MSNEEVQKVKNLIVGTCLEHVSNSKYLGQQVSEDGRSEQEMNKRIGIAKFTFNPPFTKPFSTYAVY